jgi:hypothetical protein
MKRITQYLAGVMATEVIQTLKATNEKSKSAKIAEVKSGKQFEKLEKLYAKQKELNDQIDQVTKEINKEAGVRIITYPLRVVANEKSLPQYEAVKNRIIFASHIDNIAVEVLVKFVTNEYLKSTGLKP